MNDDTDLVVAERFSAFDAVDPPDTWSRAVALGAPGTQGTAALRAGWLVAAAVVLALATGAGLVAFLSGDRSPMQVETPPAGTDDSGEASAPSVDEWLTSFDPPPIEPRMEAAVVWTGTELVVWGGYDIAACCGGPVTADSVSYNDGAALDPSTGEWRVLPDAPIGSSFGSSFAAWTEDGLVVSRGRAVALLEPFDGTWRALPDAPGLVSDLEAMGATVVSASAGAVLDAGAGTWRSLPTPPIELSSVQSAIADDEVVVVGLANGPNCAEVGSECRMEAMSYDPVRDAWRLLPSPPIGLTWHTFHMAADGGQLTVATGQGEVAVFDLEANAWGRIERPPGEVSEWFRMPVVTADGTSLVAMADLLAVRGPEGAWTGIPIESQPIPFGADSSAIRWVELVGGDGPSAFAVSLHSERNENEVALLDLDGILDAPTSGPATSVPTAEPNGLVVEPATDLVDGQIVMVSGPTSVTGVAICDADGLDEPEPTSWCDINVGPGGGETPFELTVLRRIQTGHGIVDCAERPGRCVVGVLVGNSGSLVAPITFRQDLDDLPVPSISVEPANFLDGDHVEVVISGFEPPDATPHRDDEVRLMQCTGEPSDSWFEPWERCDGARTTSLVPDADGEARIRFTVHSEILTYDGWQPCDPCVLMASAWRQPIAVTSIDVAPVDPPIRPTVRIVPDGPYEPGQRVRLEGSDFGANNDRIQVGWCAFRTDEPETELEGSTSLGYAPCSYTIEGFAVVADAEGAFAIDDFPLSGSEIGGFDCRDANVRCGLAWHPGNGMPPAFVTLYSLRQS